MANRPGKQILIRDGSPPRGDAVNTATFFAAGTTEKGDHTAPIEVTSMTRYEELCGGRSGFTAMYDALDCFFREGGSRAYVGRVVGDTPVKAGANIFDQSGSVDPGDVALDVTAKSVGEWGNSLNVEIQQDGSGNTAPFVIIVSHDTEGTLETSPTLESLAEAVSWATDESDYIDLTLGASSQNPRDQGPTSLSGGDDDDATIGDADYEEALDLFTSDLGPGQVAYPGRTTTQAHTDLLEHASAKNRVALLDAADTATVSTLTSEAATLEALSNDIERYGILLAPWVIVPGVTAGTTRTVAPSGTIAGIIARNDQAGVSPNKPSANELGISRYATDVSQAAWSDTDRNTLNSAGVAVIRNFREAVRLYGYRTLADPTSDPNFLNFANMRLLMLIVAELDEIAERFVLSEIDGFGIMVGRFGGELRAALLPHFNAGSLYGTSPDEAFTVDVGPNVNTAETLADQELRAAVALRMSPFAELVTIEVVKVPAEEAIL